ncbi:type VI secretion system contractile sheath large subunit [Sphaerotilus montanus]|uniref:Type VI secretion system protein ImpC n=1 Tax=Sphaerotilus montanus TaxID=522889 RepID=A0A7Y9U5B8_9BURK|nr:type VI secretion system contractile sheath large subunit [Sphaerotilus montanus]NYG31452.1 type VI secretion system protein ImpC [Sphaerotilus montanus]NZD55433.1 type VI secretion system contractile sheath large subunit [Sphaerotilus montanus]
MVTEQAPKSASGGQTSSTNLLDQILKSMGADIAEKKQRANTLIELFKEQAIQHSSSDQYGTVKSATVQIEKWIESIDRKISERLNEILHNSDFRELEATWRGLHYLVMNTETSSRLKIRVLDVSKDDLRKDLEEAIEVDQSALFKKVYEAEYGTFGGTPYSLLIGDYKFGRSNDDVAMLTNLSKVAATAHAPFISSADPALFDMTSFEDLSKPRDLAKSFESTELIAWREFRDTEDSRYVCLTLPRFLLRPPYGPDTRPTEGMSFTEDVNFSKVNDTDPVQPGKDHEKYLWGNSAYALGQRITNAYALYGWCAAIRGVEGGGVVGGLPVHTFKTERGDMGLKCPTETPITDRREKELDSQGFLALCYKKESDMAVFFGAQTTNKPRIYFNAQANANARISGLLPYVLAASRFAHYLKVIMRDKIGSFMTRENVESYLNNWIANYVLINDNAPQDLKAQYPLREARIDVTEDLSKPGVYNATVFLRPHFQLEELTASIRLVASLPPAVSA